MLAATGDFDGCRSAEEITRPSFIRRTKGAGWAGIVRCEIRSFNSAPLIAPLCTCQVASITPLPTRKLVVVTSARAGPGSGAKYTCACAATEATVLRRKNRNTEVAEIIPVVRAMQRNGSVAA